MRTLVTAIAATLLAGSAQAATIVLTFNTGETACTGSDGGPTNQVCSTESQFIGGDYGSTSQLAVSYDASESSGSRTSLQYTFDHFFGPTDGQAKSQPPGPASELNKIFFTPAAGYEVSFRSFTYDKLTATSSGNFVFEVRDASNNLVFNGGSVAAHGHAPNTAYFTGPLTFLFGNGGQGAIAVDNITVDVRQAATGAVPEPAAWAMMIAGFGLAGGVLRARRNPNPIRA